MTVYENGMSIVTLAVCLYCFGNGFEDYPENTVPCRVSGHTDLAIKALGLNVTPVPLTDNMQAHSIVCPLCGSQQGFTIWTKEMCYANWYPASGWSGHTEFSDFSEPEPVSGTCLACGEGIPMSFVEAIVEERIHSEGKDG
jgi:hypothetical protein